MTVSDYLEIVRAIKRGEPSHIPNFGLAYS